MSIKLNFEKGSLSMQVVLKDTAMPELLKIISEHQSDDEPALERTIKPLGTTIPDLNDPSKETERMNTARSWFAEHSAAEVLSRIGWETFPDKILLMGALYEVVNGTVGWRSADIESSFTAARHPTPGNFARDISNAIKSGNVATVTPRTYKVSKTGWLKLYEAIIKSTVEKASSKSP